MSILLLLLQLHRISEANVTLHMKVLTPSENIRLIILHVNSSVILQQYLIIEPTHFV